MKDSIEEIKKRIDIVEFIGSFVQLKKAGRNFKANCPFHNEKTPSFVVNPDRQIWRCFGACQDGGDAIAFLMKWENITFFEALQDLAQQAGVELKNLNFDDKAWSEKEKLISINEAAAKLYHYLLTEHKSGEKAREYLKERGVGLKIMKTFQLGYAPKSWDTVHSFLKKKGKKDEDILKAGLILEGRKGGYYDRFRGRLIFPIIDNRGTTLGFSGRLLDNKEKQAKYVNTPETPLYHKRDTVYGINIAKESIIKEKCVFVVEGEFDMITSFKNGIKNTVAVKGSAVTKGQLQLLKRFTQHIILALDADFSGSETTKRAIADAEKLDFRVDIVRFEGGKDPDEALQNDPVAYKKSIKKPIPIYDFIINEALDKHDTKDPYEKRDVLSDVVPFVENIQNPILLGHYVKRIAQALDLHESDINAAISQYKRKRKIDTSYKKEVTEKKKVDRFELMQKMVLSAVIQNEKPIKQFKSIREIIEPDDFIVPSYKNIITYFDKYVEKVSSGKAADSAFYIENFIENLSDPLQKVFDELLLADVSNSDVDISSNKRLLLELKRLSLKHRIKDLLKTNPEDQTIPKLTKRVSEVEKKLSSV